MLKNFDRLDYVFAGRVAYLYDAVIKFWDIKKSGEPTAEGVSLAFGAPLTGFLDYYFRVK